MIAPLTHSAALTVLRLIVVREFMQYSKSGNIVDDGRYFADIKNVFSGIIGIVIRIINFIRIHAFIIVNILR